MKIFTTTIFIICLIMFTNSVYSQTSDICQIKGLVFNEYMEPLESVTIKILEIDSSLKQVLKSDGEGAFQLSSTRNKPIIISATHIGFRPYSIEFNPLKDTTLHIYLEYEATALGGVSVTAKEPMLSMVDGNLVVNVSRIPNADNLSLAKLLNRVPGVSTENGLTLNGVSATIYIDGVKQNVNTNAILESLRGAAIDQIELISTPTAEYGLNSGGVINIKTRRSKWDGYSINIGTTGAVHRGGHWDNNSDVMFIFKKRKVFFNAYVSFNSYHSKLEQLDTTWYKIGREVDKLYENKSRLNVISALANLNWEVAKGHSLNFNLYLYDDFGRITRNNQINIKEQIGTQERYNDLNRSKGHDDLWTAQIEYKTPDSLRTRLRTSYGIIYGGLRSVNDYSNDNLGDYNRYLHSNLRMTGHRHTATLHLQQDIGAKKKLTLYAGITGTMGEINDNAIYNPINSVSNDYHSLFTGKENTLFSYLQLRYKISSKWTAIGYFAGSYTNYDLNLKSEGVNTKSIYWNYLPYLALTYSTKNYRGTIGYISGIQRPDYMIMLPGIRYEDEFSQTVGNPNLKPRINRSIVLNNLLFDYFSVTLNYSYIKDEMGRVITGTDDGKTIYTYLNYANSEKYGLFLSLPFEFYKKKFSGQIGMSLIYDKIKNTKDGYEIPYGRGRSSFNFGFNTSLQYDITDRLNVNAYLSYGAPRYSPQNYSSYYWNTNFGISYSCMKDEALTFSIEVYDPFNSSVRDNRRQYFEENFQHIKTRYTNNRSIDFTVRFKFNRGQKVAHGAKGLQPDIERFSK